VITRSPFTVAIFGALLGAAYAVPFALGDAGADTPGLLDGVSAGPSTIGPLTSDSALDELAAGRFWHATRLLRAAGAADGSHADVLTLARAEAGWTNWAGVANLLEGRDWLAEEDEALGLYLYARALEAGERWPEAARAYVAYTMAVGPDSEHGAAALVRRARTAWHAGDHEVALAALGELRASPVVRSWVGVELAMLAVADGDVGAVTALRDHVIEPRAVTMLWRAEADALLAVGDSARALEAFQDIVETASGARRTTAVVEAGRLWLAAGDTIRATPLLVEGVEAGSGALRATAAAALHDIGGHGYERTLELARILDVAGKGGRALDGYDRAARLARDAGEEMPEGARLERARLMATVRDRQDQALEEFRALRESTESERIGARTLEVWAQMRRRQGQTAAVATLRRWLLDEHPGSPEAAEVAWTNGSGAEAAGRLDEALRHYRFLAENAETHARAGEARMRTGQIHLLRGDDAAAAEVFERYLADFPDGRRWQEASYWAGRTRLAIGDSATAHDHLRHVLRQPIEYYAVMAADLLDVPYSVDLPPGPEVIEPAWLTMGLERLDVLTDAGLHRGALDEIDRLRDRAQPDRAVRLRLAEALIERGRTIQGINLGWAILADDQTWDQRLVRVTYPFPYEELVRREAAEWGIDVYVMAAIIRQESAFKVDIVSRAGAIGLMQVMPPTGAQLARAHGPEGFTDDALTKAEVNLHLGAAFFVDMSRRYENDLPLVLSAYNAGPTRATRWRSYPEAADPLRFTERIPFVETRGYVKSVRRNVGLYRVLYGQD
jgi:soluble lytic murein transglycosylase